MFRTNTFQRKFAQNITSKTQYKFFVNKNSKFTVPSINKFTVSSINESKPLPINHVNSDWSNNKINKPQIFYDDNLVKKIQFLPKPNKSFTFQQRAMSLNASNKNEVNAKKSIVDSNSFTKFVIIKILFIGFTFFVFSVMELTRGHGSFNLFTLITIFSTVFGLFSITIDETIGCALVAFVCLILHMICS